MWQDAAKTLWDPCPAGWRVPKAKGKGMESPWDALSSNDGAWQEVSPVITGYLFNTPAVYGGTLWYPTSGRRALNGYFDVYGTHGQYWTSSLSGGVGNVFNSSIGAVVLDITNHQRAYCFPVRCIRE